MQAGQGSTDSAGLRRVEMRAGEEPAGHPGGVEHERPPRAHAPEDPSATKSKRPASVPHSLAAERTVSPCLERQLHMSLEFGLPQPRSGWRS